MRGRPLNQKCPKCKRGAYGRPPQVHGVKRHEVSATKHERMRARKECLDCGHVWWSLCVFA